MGVAAALGVSASGRSPYPKDKANGVVQGVLSAVGPGKPFAFYGSFNLFIWGAYVNALTTTAGSLNASVAAIGAIAAGSAIASANLPKGTTVATLAGGNNITLALPIETLFARSAKSSNRLSDLASTDFLLGATVSGLGVPGATTVAAIEVVAVPPSVDGPGIKGVVRLSADVTIEPQNTQPTPFEFQLVAAGGVTVTGADAAASFSGAAILYTGTAQLERSFDSGLTFLPCNIAAAGTLASWAAGTPVSQSFAEPEREILYRVNALVLGAGTINYRLSATGQAATSLNVP